MKRRIISLILAICMMLSLAAAVSAANQPAPQYMQQAVLLNELGLLKGAGRNADGSINYALPRRATRIEGLILLLRLLGEEEEALAYEGECPFADLSGDNARYAAYAREKGYTRGVSATRFDNGPLVANAFLTFVLRSLGYPDVDYNTAFVAASQAGLIERGEFTDQRSAITRDECVKICYNALLTEMADDSGTLLQTLLRRGKVRSEAAEKLLADDPEILPATNVDLMAWQKAFIGSLDPQYRQQTVWYDLPEDICFIYDADSPAEYKNNVLYAFMMGDYSLCFCFDSKAEINAFSDWFRKDFQTLCCQHPDLMGAVANQLNTIYIDYPSCGDGTAACCVLQIDSESKPALTLEQVWNNQQSALKEAGRIHDLLHDKGLIKDGMTQKETAKAIGDYLLTLKVKVGTQDASVTRGDAMLYDSAYGCLVNRKSDCVGWAASFILLCHMEGIQANGISGFFLMDASVGHEMSRVILDGSEYLYDWYNRIPLVTVDQIRKIFFVNEETLAA